MFINENWRIETCDDKNITLIKLGVAERGNNIGEQTERVVGYYSSISDALKAMCKKEIFGTGLKDLETINSKIEELYDLIDKRTKELNL